MISSFTLPFPISVNKVYHAPFRSICLTPKAREWKDHVSNQLKSLLKANRIPRFVDPVQIHYVVLAPDRRGRDLFNLDKLMTDTIVKSGILADDLLIDDGRFTRSVVEPDQARVEVFIKQIEAGKLWLLN